MSEGMVGASFREGGPGQVIIIIIKHCLTSNSSLSGRTDVLNSHCFSLSLKKTPDITRPLCVFEAQLLMFRCSFFTVTSVFSVTVSYLASDCAASFQDQGGFSHH